MSRKSSINKVKRSNAISKSIENSLVMHLYLKGHSPISTHVNIQGMMEADVLSVSKSDYVYEYEVKISVADFKKDFNKNKHLLITEGRYLNKELFLVPNYFYFVVKENLVNLKDIPTYAGLIYYNDKMEFITIKKAPLIHKNKATNLFIRDLSHKLTCKLVFNKII